MTTEKICNTCGTLQEQPPPSDTIMTLDQLSLEVIEFMEERTSQCWDGKTKARSQIKILDAFEQMEKQGLLLNVQSKADELKACPFCGGGAVIGKDNKAGRWVQCFQCQASTAIRYSLMEDAEPLVIEAWNRRAK